jgi:hypothetical protein
MRQVRQYHCRVAEPDLIVSRSSPFLAVLPEKVDHLFATSKVRTIKTFHTLFENHFHLFESFCEKSTTFRELRKPQNGFSSRFSELLNDF